jgi:hypothetical protein
VKSGKNLRQKVDALSAEAFIAGGAATQADNVPRLSRTQRRITGRGKMAAEGFRRTSLDLPQELYRQLKIAAAEDSRTLQSIAEEALKAWLAARLDS